MLFSTQRERPKSKPERNNGKTLVERDGYLSAQKRITNMILAGQRLKDFRTAQERYDFPDGKIDEDAWDPTRSKNFDLADASQMQYDVRGRLIASQTAREAQEEAIKADLIKDEVPS